MEKGVYLQGCSLDELSRAITEEVTEKVRGMLEGIAPKIPERYLTRDEVCGLFKISLKTLYTRERLGDITGYKIGGRKLFKASEVEKVLVKVNK